MSNNYEVRVSMEPEKELGYSWMIIDKEHSSNEGFGYEDSYDKAFEVATNACKELLKKRATVYEWRYVTSKYSILTPEGQDWNYRIVRYYNQEGEEDITEEIRNNVLRDIILELLEVRRELDSANAKIAELSQHKTLVDYERMRSHRRASEE